MTRAFAFGCGIAFGFVLSWVQLTNPERIRHMLLLDEAYYFVLMAVAMAVGTIGTRLLRRRRARALLTGEPVAWTSTPLARRHVVGSALFGIGWGISNSCPGPIAAQLGQGVFWSLCTLAGFFVGARVHAARERRGAQVPETAPVLDAL